MSKEEELIAAAQIGDTATVRRLLYPYGRNRFISTIARRLRNEPLINVNHTDATGKTALMLAAEHNHDEVIDLLLNYPGININQRNDRDNEKTALMYAVPSSSAAVVRLLLSDPRVDNNLLANLPVVAAAAATNTVDVMRLLRADYRVSVNQSSANGESPLMIAIRSSRRDIVNLLLSDPYVDINYSYNYRETALTLAAKIDDIETVSALLTNNQLDIDRYSQGLGALNEARGHGHNQIVEMLMANPSFRRWYEQHESPAMREAREFLERMQQTSARIAARAAATAPVSTIGASLPTIMGPPPPLPPRPTLGSQIISATSMGDSERVSVLLENNNLLNDQDILDVYSALQIARDQDNNAIIEMLMTLPSISTMDANMQDANTFAAQVADAAHARAVARRPGFRPNAAVQDAFAFDPDGESSMKRLTPWQEATLSEVSSHYRAELNRKGDNDGVIREMLDSLKEMYNHDPIKVTEPNTQVQIILPLQWDDLLAQKTQYQWTEDQFTAMLKEYHKNELHTAYRYFLKPNPWMSKDAEFVGRDTNGNGWANFVEYVPMIATLWLAASDPNEAPHDNMNQGKLTVQERQKAFLGQVAEINRSHNRDHGADDLQGDKPSCDMGVKSRLFTAVIDHCKFSIDPEALANEELSKYFQEYYGQILQSMNDASYAAVKESIIDGKYIASLNIPVANNIKSSLIDQFNDKFRRFDRAMGTRVMQLVSEGLNESESVGSNEAPQDQHFYKVFTKYNLQNVLDKEDQRRARIAPSSSPSP